MRIHDLRHSFASRALALGESLDYDWENCSGTPRCKRRPAMPTSLGDSIQDRRRPWREHEGATGTLERSDLTAAFGAAR